MSRPAHEPTSQTRSQVSALSSVGNNQSVIAEFLDIDEKTLRKYYHEELRTAEIKANAAVAQSLYNQATKEGSVAAAIFWLKTRAGWSEKVYLGVGQDPNAEPTKIEVTYVESSQRDAE